MIGSHLSRNFLGYHGYLRKFCPENGIAPDPDSLELLETEKQRIEDRRADLVARVQDTGTTNPYLRHIEIQNDNNT